uniref:Replication protein A 70 kDa DNA-binding subunit B/D first OB fold domain-containing protein n=1 Tax=Lactuca sativa TaxID=4236 RepID=A0A9R1XSJ1_LACSA|nr:hypothetical protein LSAT_V11C100048250 [Lactuca sativa]
MFYNRNSTILLIFLSSAFFFQINGNIKSYLASCHKPLASNVFLQNNEIWSIEMILIDEYGNKIQAAVSKRNIYRFKNVVKDGMAFYIKGPNFAALCET